MAENFLIFKKYINIGIATEIGEQLKANHIEFIIEDNTKFNKQYFDPTFINNSFNYEISLKVRQQDFTNAQNVLNDYYKELANLVDKDYYLFEFTDQELLEIIYKPDEWGELDNQLAQKILADRGKGIKPEIINLRNAKRAKKISKGENASKYLFDRYNNLGIFGEFLSIFFGYDLLSSKKTMPDGKQVYTYREEDRKHGIKIFITGIVMLILWLVYILASKYKEF